MITALETLNSEQQDVFESSPIPPFEVWFKENYKFAPQNSHFSEITDCDPYRYQLNLAFLFGDLDTPEVTVIKGTQLGLTHEANALMIYEPAVRGRNACMYLPRNEDAMQYSDPMLKYALDCIPSIQDQLMVDALKKDASNTNKKKTLKRGQIYSRSMESPSAFDSIPVSTVVQDEISRATLRVKKSKEEEGENPYDAAKSRMEGQRYRKHIAFSSPGEAQVCLVNKIYEKMQVLLEEQFECPRCKGFIGLDFGDKKASHGMRWETVEGANGKRDNLATSMSACYLCPRCHETFEHHEMIEQDELTGELRNSDLRLDLEKRCYFYIDEKGECTGKVAPKPYSVGARIPGMLSRTKTFQMGVYEFLEAVDAIKEGDNSKMMVFDKKYRAIAYVKVEDLGEKVPYTYLMARFERYCERGKEREFNCPDPVQFITGWWDLQENYIQGMYVGWGYKEECWVLKSIMKMGDPRTTNVMDIIDHMRRYEFRKPNGSTMRARLTGIDSGWQPHLAYDMSVKLGKARVIPTKGAKEYLSPNINHPDTPKSNCSHTFMTNVGKHQMTNLYYGRMKVQDAGPAYIHLPKPDPGGITDRSYNDESYLDQEDLVDEHGIPFSNGMSEEICKQMVSEVEILKGGRLIYQKTRPRNEGLDCMIGNMAMVKIARLPKYGLRLREYSEVAATAPAFQTKGGKTSKREGRKNWGQIGQ